MADGGEASSQLESGNELIMLVPRTPIATTQIIHTSVVECNYSADTPHQHAAFYLSALAAQFPELLPLAKELFQDLGYAVTEVTEDTLAVYAITLQPWIDNVRALAIFGQLALIIYKNIDDRSYAGVMQRRTAAIKAVAGVPSDILPGKEDVLLSVSIAKNIRNIVGGNNKFRAALVNIILANRDGLYKMNSVCRYLAEIISWTEMGLLKLVRDTIWITNSPVLNDSRVEHEVKNLREAYERIDETDFPPFFRILHPTEAHKIAVSRFSTLAEVAKRYKSEPHSTGSRYAASSNRRDTLVNELVSIHHDHMSRPQVLGEEMQKVIRFLYGI